MDEEIDPSHCSGDCSDTADRIQIGAGLAPEDTVPPNPITSDLLEFCAGGR